MKSVYRFVASQLLLVSILCLAGTSAFADVPLASRESDRRAKVAAPSANESIIYLYRADDGNKNPIAVTLNGRETARLASRTFTWWRIKPGRNELVADRSTLPLQTESGRVYYVEVSRGSIGAPALRIVSFADGRTQVQRSQLIAQLSEPAYTASAPTGPTFRSDARSAITLKTGSLALQDESQSILGSPRLFDDSASSVFALEGEWLFQPDVSMGIEFIRYSNDYSTPSASGTGKIGTTLFLFNLKHYFLTNGAWQPYIGAGAGIAATNFSGAITGSTSGLGVQLAAGLQWRNGPFALRGEYKHINAKTEDDGGQEVDVSSSGFFLGAGFYF